MAEIKKFLDHKGLAYFCKKFQDYPNNEILGTVINAIDSVKVDKVDYAPVDKTDNMTQPVGKDSDGKLWTEAINGSGDSGNSVLYTNQSLTEEQKQQARTNISAANSAIEEEVARNSIEIFGLDIPTRSCRVTFNAVWDAANNKVSESASLAEICFYDANGDACTIESIAADSAYDTKYTANNAIDGDLSTLWSSKDDATVQHWLEITFPSAISPVQMGICLRTDYNYGLIDEMTVEALLDDGTWFKVAHISDEKENWNGQTERRFDLKCRLPSLEEKYGKTVSIAADALARNTRTGTRIVISDAIAGAPMSCACESQITLSGLNMSPVGEVSFTGQFKQIKMDAPLSAGNYVFSARCESTDIDSERSLVCIGNQNLYIAHDNARHSVAFTLSAETDNFYMYSSDSPANGTGDTVFWREIMIVSGSEDKPYEHPMKTIICDADTLMLMAQTNILSADTEISITYARRNEWLNAILSATKSTELNAQTLGYVTPEMFGAVGDGVTDDAQAVQACIDLAAELGYPAKCMRSYAVTSPVRIGSRMDVEINMLKYMGIDCAVVLHGESSRVCINRIESSGSGLAIRTEDSKVAHNEVRVGDIVSKVHGILLENAGISKSIQYQNVVHFRCISAGGDGCYCIASSHKNYDAIIGETIFFGGQCRNADWAWYGIGANNKFYNFEVETNIKGGFFFTDDANALIIGDRHAESMRDGEYPYIKISTPRGISTSSAAAVCSLRYISAYGLYVNEVDVSEVHAYSTNNDGLKAPLISSGSLGCIDCRLTPYMHTGESNAMRSQYFGERTLIWGPCLIFQGVPEKYWQVTESMDLRTITEDTPAMPTVFDIACANAEIDLHPSYCFMGISRFEVIQTAEYTATIRDYFTGNVIFNGANLGEGTFEVRTYLNGNYALLNGKNMIWKVRKIGESNSGAGDGSGEEEPVMLTAGDIDNMDVSTFENKLVSEVEK